MKPERHMVQGTLQAAGRHGAPAWQRPAAFILGGLLSAGYLLLLGNLVLEARAGASLRDLTATGWMILIGGPCTQIPWTLLALRWERPAGAVLWLGGALAALGFGFRAGPYIGQYLWGLALVVVPQVVEGSLFLLHARGVRAPSRGMRRGA